MAQRSASTRRNLLKGAAVAAGANFLFERPAAFWVVPKKARPALQAAE